MYSLDYAFQEPPALTHELLGSYLESVRTMGRRLAEMHLRLAAPTDDPAFTPEPFNDFYRQGLYHGYLGLTGRRLEFLRQRFRDLNEDVRALAAKVLELEPAILEKFRAIFVERIASMRIRFHGRLHLGHVLMREDGDVVFFDFSGDPSVHLSERRIRRCPLRDVATMLASFGYATQVAMRNFLSLQSSGTLTANDLRAFLRFWYSQVTAAFIRAYWEAAGDASYIPPSRADGETLLTTYLLERAMLDIRPDIEDKPELAGMPFRLILHLLNVDPAQVPAPQSPS
jgi:maltose alpha-D-glucosyltransferase/alpha-amylase